MAHSWRMITPHRDVNVKQCRKCGCVKVTVAISGLGTIDYHTIYLSGIEKLRKAPVCNTIVPSKTIKDETQ